jgi:hypothetical protein
MTEHTESADSYLEALTCDLEVARARMLERLDVQHGIPDLGIRTPRPAEADCEGAL